ncbi:MAG: NIL domain-containing protein, partial [Ruminococcus sp.]|nr:NIL domain-containing protein [Ruminococcus sp.]
DNIKGGSRLRIVYSANSAFEPVIANMILKFNEPVNILKAATRNVGGVAKGEMILELLKTSEKKNEMITYLKERNIEIEELDGREEV